MTKADYDELKFLDERGYKTITNDNNGHKVAWKVGRGLGVREGCFKRVIPRGGNINIAAAIAEYEREQEGKA